jgi:hypothetical protein
MTSTDPLSLSHRERSSVAQIVFRLMAFAATWNVSGDMAFSSRYDRDWFLMSHLCGFLVNLKIVNKFLAETVFPLCGGILRKGGFELRRKEHINVVGRLSVRCRQIMILQLIPLEGIPRLAGHETHLESWLRGYDSDTLFLLL